VKVISHRGNLHGRVPKQENHPSYIQSAIDAGYEVELDVWYVDGEYYLGHDSPQYPVYEAWLTERQDVLWCHAKNPAALEQMLSVGLHCFWHETDHYTLTSRGIPWCYPDNHLAGGVTVVKDCPAEYSLPEDALGVCTDYPEDWSER
jgi:hypothetical protein